MTTTSTHDTYSESMRGVASGAQQAAAAQPKADPYAGKDLVFVPAYAGDKPDRDTASMRGYQWLPKNNGI